jgi:hypothetical protein
VHDGSDKLDFLLHAFGELLDFFIPPLEGFKTIKHDFAFLICFLAGKAFELGEVEEVFTYFHFLIEASFFREISHLRRVSLVEEFASEVHLATVGSGDGGDDADGGGFACAIGTEHSEDGAGLYFKADFIHGEVVSVAFGYFVELEYRHMWG